MIAIDSHPSDLNVCVQNAHVLHVSQLPLLQIHFTISLNLWSIATCISEIHTGSAASPIDVKREAVDCDSQLRWAFAS